MAPRTTLLSVLFGVGAAIVVALIGPLYGGLVIVLSFALVFRSAERVALKWLLSSFAVTWSAALVAEVGATRNLPSDGPFVWAAVGFLPLLLSAATVVIARARPPTTTS